MASASGPDIWHAYLLMKELVGVSEEASDLEAELEAFDSGHASDHDVRKAFRSFDDACGKLIESIKHDRARLASLTSRAVSDGPPQSVTRLGEGREE